jgi:hypothetical protein
MSYTYIEFHVLYPHVGQFFSGSANAIKPFLPSIGNMLYPSSRISPSVGCNLGSRAAILILLLSSVADSLVIAGEFERILLSLLKETKMAYGQL